MEKDFIEIRWHGRAGQGAKSASQIIAEAVMEYGKYVQSFPEYGAERTGAPMRAFNRIADRPISVYTGVDNPDYVVVIDPDVLFTVNVLEGMKEGSVLLANTKYSPDEIRKKLNVPEGIKIYTVNARDISLEELGGDFPNTPMLGALVRVSKLLEIEKLTEKFKEHFTAKLGSEMVEKNIRAIKRGYKEVKE